MSNNESTVSEYRRRVVKAMNFISLHLADNPSLDEIAEAAHFSKFHFHRIFKSFVGETVAGFTRRARLEKAANLLLFDGEASVTEVAMKCGFSSSQNFAKQFKKHFGESPVIFRKSRAATHARPTESSQSIGGARLNVSLFDAGAESLTGARPRADFEVVVRQCDELVVAYTRHIGAYSSQTTRDAIRNLCGVLRSQNLASAKIVGVSWDNPDITPSEKCRYDLGVVVDSGGPITKAPRGFELQTIPAGQYAVHSGHVQDEDLERGWDELVGQWLPRSGYLPSDTLCYESFERVAAAETAQDWTQSIYLPVRPFD